MGGGGVVGGGGGGGRGSQFHQLLLTFANSLELSVLIFIHKVDTPIVFLKDLKKKKFQKKLQAQQKHDKLSCMQRVKTNTEF